MMSFAALNLRTKETNITSSCKRRLDLIRVLSLPLAKRTSKKMRRTPIRFGKKFPARVPNGLRGA